MHYRSLGRPRLKVSEIGLGTEYLNRKSRDCVRSIIHEAIKAGINYYDIVFAFPDYRDNLGDAFRDYRKKVILCGHICCSIWKSGAYRLSRSLNFKGLSRQAGLCTRCGACVKRCPFGVEIIGKMEQAIRIFKR